MPNNNTNNNNNNNNNNNKDLQFIRNFLSVRLCVARKPVN